MGKVRIAIAGVGNCASSLVQGLEYYKDADDGARPRSASRRFPERRLRARARLPPAAAAALAPLAGAASAAVKRATTPGLPAPFSGPADTPGGALSHGA